MLTYGNLTLHSLLQKQAERFPEKNFIVFKDETITYHEFLNRTEKMAGWLMDKGIRKGDTVAAFLSNSPLFYETWFSCAAIGAVLLPINTASTPSELEYFLSHSDSKGLIYEGNLVNEQHLMVAEEQSLLFIQKDEENWSREKEKCQFTPADQPIYPGDVACIMYTSGTTAKPKGVLITHENYLFAGHSAVLYQQLTPEDRYLVFLPLFHVNSQYYTSMAMLAVGGTIILLERFKSSTFWDDVKKYRPTVSSLVATVIKMLLECPKHPSEKGHTLQKAGYGLFVHYQDLLKFQERFGVKLYQWYGMTESITTNIVTPLHEEMMTDPESGIVPIGKPGLGQDVRIIKEDGEEAGPGEVGEIIIKSPSLMKGYYKNPEATAKTLQNGYLYTGDKGYYNEEGFIWFVDRNKDMIKRAGENISSIEVENVLSSHASVEECAVIGEPDSLREEAVIAYIRCSEGKQVSSDELNEFCKERLSYFKVPQEFRFAEDFPRTSIGKIQKNLLRK
ncbi:class I adenylate-forming enzyme family protein [Bacillus sp. J33]|uniref:class I adenylate-forming enzyme family protein n=1 Tax=Bacillus sp. J33 TaxID=935836 RepID=UPI0004797590|nr:AMP-binding protein [Bacillus sp. J33]